MTLVTLSIAKSLRVESLEKREYDHEQASGPYGPWSVPSRPRRCGPVDRLTGHCQSGCGAVRVARSARYEAGCSLAAVLRHRRLRVRGNGLPALWIDYLKCMSLQSLQLSFCCG